MQKKLNVINESINQNIINIPDNIIKQQSDIYFYDMGLTANPYFEFSNFYNVSPIFIDGEYYETNEHYYQSEKTNDPAIRQKIIAAPTPGRARELGEILPIDSNFYANRDQVMLKALKAKFIQHPSIGDILKSTGNSRLFYHTVNDSYFGDGGDGSGQNKLGKLLMQVRQELNSY